MYLIRDIMYCKPGQVGAMVQKFKALNKVMTAAGHSPARILTDFTAERYWCVVTEMVVPSIDEYEKMLKQELSSPAYQNAMKGYHEHVDYGRREVYRIEE